MNNNKEYILSILQKEERKDDLTDKDKTLIEKLLGKSVIVDSAKYRSLLERLLLRCSYNQKGITSGDIIFYILLVISPILSIFPIGANIIVATSVIATLVYILCFWVMDLYIPGGCFAKKDKVTPLLSYNQLSLFAPSLKVYIGYCIMAICIYGTAYSLYRAGHWGWFCPILAQFNLYLFRWRAVGHVKDILEYIQENITEFPEED